MEVTGPASVAGRWVADDDMDFGYTLTIGADGGYALVIDRGKLSRCETTGTLVAGADARHYTLPQAKHTCDGPTTMVALEVEIASFTGEQLVVRETGGPTPRRWTFRRAPEN